jgi:hypothetical protein
VAAQQLLCLDSDLESRVLLRIEEEGGEQRCAPIVFLEVSFNNAASEGAPAFESEFCDLALVS